MNKEKMDGVMPSYSPLYPNGSVYFDEYRRLSAYCSVNEEFIKSIVPAPLTSFSNRVELFLGVVTKIRGIRPYKEAGIAIPVKYKGITGTTVIEYVTSDEALCLGREPYGYPKKMADEVEFNEINERIYGHAKRYGKKFLSIDFHESTINKGIEREPYPQPRLEVKKIPGCDGKSWDVNKLIAMRFKAKTMEIKEGEAKVSFEKSDFDPFYKLSPVKVEYAIFSVCSFTLSPGEVVEDLLTVQK